MSAKLDLLYFAWVREAVGRDHETVTLPPDVHSVAQLVDWLKMRDATMEVFDEPERLRFAVDEQFAQLDTALTNAREVAIFPPVTGG